MVSPENAPEDSIFREASMGLPENAQEGKEEFERYEEKLISSMEYDAFQELTQRITDDGLLSKLIHLGKFSDGGLESPDISVDIRDTLGEWVEKHTDGSLDDPDNLTLKTTTKFWLETYVVPGINLSGDALSNLRNEWKEENKRLEEIRGEMNVLNAYSLKRANEYRDTLDEAQKILKKLKKEHQELQRDLDVRGHLFSQILGPGWAHLASLETQHKVARCHWLAEVIPEREMEILPLEPYEKAFRKDTGSWNTQIKLIDNHIGRWEGILYPHKLQGLSSAEEANGRLLAQQYTAFLLVTDKRAGCQEYIDKVQQEAPMDVICINPYDVDSLENEELSELCYRETILHRGEKLPMILLMGPEGRIMRSMGFSHDNPERAVQYLEKLAESCCP